MISEKLLPSFFFSSRRRHTRSVSAFLLNRSSDLTSLKWLETNNLFNNLIQRNQSAAFSSGKVRPNHRSEERLSRNAETELVCRLLLEKKKDYLALNTNHLVELVDGRIEVLPMPTEEHQSIIAYLYEL